MNDWDTIEINNFDLLKNVRCSDEIWQIKGITLEEALEKGKLDPEVKELHWYKNNGGDGRMLRDRIKVLEGLLEQL